MWIMFGKRLATAHPEELQLMTIFDVDTCGVDRARNFCLAQAMASGADCLLMVDSDTWVETLGVDAIGVQLVRMIMAGRARGAAIIGAPVMRRLGVLDTTPAVYMQLPDGKYRPVPAAELPSHGVAEVDAIGAACVAIDLRKIGDSVFKFTDELSEDLEFCRQVKKIGSTILVDTRVQTGHWNTPLPLNFPRGA
jgi:hypothetical protein